MRSRFTWMGLVVAIALIAIAAALALVVSERGSAGAAPEFVPLAKAEVSPQLRAGIQRSARESGIDSASVYEVGAFGTGKYRRSAFVGTDRTGAVRVSLSTGFGFTPFMTESKLFQSGEAMTITEGFSGPSTEVRNVGMTGAVKSNVDRVTIERRNGSVVDAPLAKAPVGDLKFFASFSDTAEHFPMVVRAYDGAGTLVGQYRSEAKALCPRSNPSCLK